MRFGALAAGAVLFAVSFDASAHKETYPMSADTYRQQFEARFGRYRERLEERMTEHRFAPDKREDARKRMAFLELIVRNAIVRATQDGTVTEAEATQIRDLSKQSRDQIYSSLGFERVKGE
jgi:hypothetical protein